MAKACKKEKSEFTVGPWTLSTSRSHILKSMCERSKEGCLPGARDICDVCRYSHELELPSYPEMVFPENRLTLRHDSGVEVVFDTLEALKLVDAHKETVQHVAAAREWLATRGEGLKEVKETVKHYDWSFTTTYKGSLVDNGASKIKVEPSDEGINYELLKQHEKIHYYDDIILYEDELADNGIAELRVKVRVMASGLFVLLRYFLRVDDVMIRINDTRIYHQACTDYMTREYSSREVMLPHPKLPLSVLKDANKVSDILPHTNIIKDKLILPS